MSRMALIAALAALPLTAQAADTAAALRDKALTDPTAYSVLESLTTEIGPRPAGSPAQKRAMEWGLATFKSLGFQNVHVEPFTVNAWVRGAEAAEVVSPFPQKLAILGLGGSVPTPAGGIEAEIVVFPSFAGLMAAAPGSLAGKIAVVTQVMTRTQDGSGYGAAVGARAIGASEAGRRGAIGFLIRSISTSESRLPHTGALRYADDAPKIPAAALSTVDAELLERMAARGKPVRVRLSLDSHVVPDAPAWNVVGEVVGREKPDEVIVIGGHLDSWDPGTGAIDDGAGVAITTAAGHLIASLPQHPRRTVRVVMWGSEEMSGSGAAYGAAHKAEVPKIVLAAESDLGADPVWMMRLPAGVVKQPGAQALPDLLAPLKVILDSKPSQFGGSDTDELQEIGVPVAEIRQDATHYFDIHHSADDTLDKVDPKSLAQNVATWASFIYIAAESDIDFRAGAKPTP